MCGLTRGVVGWDRELLWAVQRLQGKALISQLLRIAWSSYIYHVWKERYSRIHTGKVENSEQIANLIKEAVRYQLVKLKKVKADSVNILLYRSWGLSDNIFT